LAAVQEAVSPGWISIYPHKVLYFLACFLIRAHFSTISGTSSTPLWKFTY